MKKLGIVIRIPIFFDLELEVEDDDFDEIVDEWDKCNFANTKSIINNYINLEDLEDLDISGIQERYGELEIVDIDFENKKKLNETKEELEMIDIISKCNTIAPKGKLN